MQQKSKQTLKIQIRECIQPSDMLTSNLKLYLGIVNLFFNLKFKIDNLNLKF